MKNNVTERFVSCIKRLKSENKIKSYRQFALSVDYFPQGLNEILKGKRNATVELIEKSSIKYNINTNYLFLGKGSMFAKQQAQSDILTIVTDDKGVEKIVHVPITAQAGYAGNISNPVFFDQLKTFSLPGFGFNSGTYRCFDVSGDSMEPSIYNQEQLICSYVDPQLWLTNLRSHMVYVVVTSDTIVVKRMSKAPGNNKTVILYSDNDFYEPFELKYRDIKEIWTVKYKISPFNSSPKHIRNGLHQEFDQMRSTVTEQSSLIKNLNSTIEKLLNQSNNKTLQE